MGELIGVVSFYCGDIVQGKICVHIKDVNDIGHVI